MRDLNLDNVEESGEGQRLPLGGYVCRITKVTDVPSREYLEIEYDIAEGEFKDYYKQLYNEKSFWGGRFFQSYKDKAISFFKRFIVRVENSNSNYKFDNNETKLVGKFVGLVLSEEEYKSNEGKTKTRLYVSDVYTISDIRNKKFNVREFKKLADVSDDIKKKAESLTPVDDDKLPF